MRRLFRWFVISVCTIAALIVGAIIAARFPDSSSETSKQEKSEQPSMPALLLHPNAVAVGLNAAPGAIVCSNLQNLTLLYRLYSDHWEQEMQRRMTKGASESINGPVSPEPDPADYGCWVLPPGTPVETRNGEGLLNGVRIVRARLRDGTLVQGLTLPAMLTAFDRQ